MDTEVKDKLGNVLVTGSFVAYAGVSRRAPPVMVGEVKAFDGQHLRITPMDSKGRDIYRMPYSVAKTATPSSN